MSDPSSPESKKSEAVECSPLDRDHEVLSNFYETNSFDEPLSAEDAMKDDGATDDD